MFFRHTQGVCRGVRGCRARPFSMESCFCHGVHFCNTVLLSALSCACLLYTSLRRCGNFGRCPYHLEYAGQGHYPKDADGSCKYTARCQGGEKFPAKPPLVAAAVKLRQDNGYTGAESIDDKDKKVHDRTGNTDGLSLIHILSGRQAPARNCLPMRSIRHPGGPRGLLWQLTAPPCLRTCWRVNCSDMRRERLQGQKRAEGPDCSSLPIMAPCFWTRWRG